MSKMILTWYCDIWTIFFVISSKEAYDTSISWHTRISAFDCFMFRNKDRAIIFGYLCYITIKMMTGCTYVCPTILIPWTELSVVGVAIVATFLKVGYVLYFYVRTWMVSILGESLTIILGFHVACCCANNGKYKIFEFHFYLIFIFYEK